MLLMENHKCRAYSDPCVTHYIVFKSDWKDTTDAYLYS